MGARASEWTNNRSEILTPSFEIASCRPINTCPNSRRAILSINFLEALNAGLLYTHSAKICACACWSIFPLLTSGSHFVSISDAVVSSFAIAARQQGTVVR